MALLLLLLLLLSDLVVLFLKKFFHCKPFGKPHLEAEKWPVNMNNKY